MLNLEDRADWNRIVARLREAGLAEVAREIDSTPGVLAAAWRRVHAPIEAGARSMFAGGGSAPAAEALPPEPGEQPEAEGPAIAWRIGWGEVGARTHGVVIARSVAAAVAAVRDRGAPASIERLGPVIATA